MRFFLIILISLSSCKDKDIQILSIILKENRDENQGWLFPDGVDVTRSTIDSTTHIINKIELSGERSLVFINIGQKKEDPSIGVFFVIPQISRAKSIQNTIISPLELYYSLNKSIVIPPEELLLHHKTLSKMSIFDSIPRIFDTPPWNITSPNLGTEYGPNNLCEGIFSNNWAWFSMGHGVINKHTQVPAKLKTNSTVITEISGTRCIAVCLPHFEVFNGKSPQAKFIISNKILGGIWVDLYESRWMGRGEGVGFQTYGPAKGNTRISIITKNNEEYYFYAGASWGDPIDFYQPLN